MNKDYIYNAFGLTKKLIETKDNEAQLNQFFRINNVGVDLARANDKTVHILNNINTGEVKFEEVK
jgi:hypothetical protein